MAGPTELDVVLDADGKSVFTAFETIQREIARVRQAVRDIGKDSYSSGAAFGQALSARLKEMEQAMGRMRTLTGPGTMGGDFEAALKQQTQTAKQELALQERNRKESVARQVAAEAEGNRLISAQNKASAAADTAADKAREASAKAVRSARQAAARDQAIDDAKSIRDLETLNIARSKNIDLLQRLRQAQKTETDPDQLRAVSSLITIEKARNAELERTLKNLNMLKMAADNRLELNGNLTAREAARAQTVDYRVGKASTPLYVRDQLDQNGGDTQATKLGLQFEQELARRQVLAATTEQERIAALQNLDIANKRVVAIDRISREEQNALNVEERLSRIDQQGSQKAQLSLARQYAEEQIAQVGVQQALLNQKEKVIAAERELAQATEFTRSQAQQTLDLENRRLGAVTKQANAAEAEQRNSLAGRAKTAIFNTALYGGIAGAGYGALSTVQNSVSDIIALEDEFAKLQAISDSTDQQMQGVKATIYGIGDSSRFAVNDLVKVSQTLAQAGISAGQMGDVLKSVQTLANASGSTPDEAVNLVTSALGAFQLQASDSSRIADLLTAALNRTKLTVQQVGQGIQYVGATAYEQNISLETLLATMGAVAQGGVRSGSTIGTGMRELLVDLQTPTAKLKFQLDRLGISQDEVNVKTHGLASVLETLKEKGFGATQAYEGLERRGAAFYLVAKNNTDVMSQLQLSFAVQGQAAIANERAMNSLTAQWQRFKNVLQESLAGALQQPMDDLQHILDSLSNRLTAMRERSAEMASKQAQGPEGYAKDNQGFGGSLGKYADYALNYDIGSLYESGLRKDMVALGLMTSATKEANASSVVFSTQIKQASEEVTKHQDAVTGVDKELERLKTQQKDLIGNQREAQAETVTLTARFEGLAKYLGTTKNAYLDLTQAMARYRGEQSGLLASSLNGQIAAQDKQNQLDQTSLTGTIRNIKNNPQLMSSLTPREKSELNNPTDPAFASTMRDAADRVSKSNTDLAQVLRDASIFAGRISAGVAENRINQQQANTAEASSTPFGIALNTFMTNIQSRVDALNGLAGPERAAEGGRITTTINTELKELDSKIAAERSPIAKGFLKDAADQLRQSILTVAGEIKPTQEEIKAAKEAAAEQKRAEAELRKRPYVTTADVDAVVNGGTVESNFADRIREFGERSRDGQVSAKGAVSSMQVMPGTITDPGFGVRPAQGNSMAEINRVGRDYANALLAHYMNETVAAAAYNWGTGNVDSLLKKTGGDMSAFTARLPSETRSYVGRVTAAASGSREAGVGGYSIAGLDDAEVQLKVETVQKALENRGITDATVSVDKARKKIVVTLRPGARFTKDKTTDSTGQTNLQLDQLELSVDQEGLTTALKKVATDSSDSAVDSARAALDRVNQDVLKIARQELANAGKSEGSVEGQARIRQAQAQISENVERFNVSVSEAIVKNVEFQLKAIERSFEAAIAPAERLQAIADARVTGLSYASNDNKIPDFVKAAASRNAGLAKENTDRATLAALPDKIASTEAQRAGLIDGLDHDGGDTPQIRAEIDKLAESITNLKKQRDALSEALGAGGNLVPKTIGQGLDQAIAQYQQANDIGKSFHDTVMQNLTGSIDAVHTGLTDMFTSIFTGSKSALGAFGEFAAGIGKYLEQLAAKFVASQLMSLLFKLVGTGASGLSPTANIDGNIAPDTINTGTIDTGIGAIGNFTGGEVGKAPAINRLGGGSVENGDVTKDSVRTNLARGEWVIRKKAVDSVGSQFMARLNNHGAAALGAQASMPKINFAPKQQMGVYVVAPTQQPSMSKDDVLVAISQDILANGETKKLIKFVQQGG